MNLAVFVIILGFRCVNSYSIIQAPDNPSPTFKIYWNVPTFQCKSKGIPFTHIHEDFGIIQNEGDQFRGGKISIMYNPGKFPTKSDNDAHKHGEIPQRGKLDEHLEAFRNDLERDVPDDAFDGIGIIDMEQWRPVYHQNYGSSVFIKNESYRHEREVHGWWKDHWLQAEAKINFELSARRYMEQTLDLAKELRPLAQWGYYGFPYCFNMEGKNKKDTCSEQTKRQNDEAYWLWAGSTALFPSVYSGVELSPYQLATLIKGRVAEAKRVALEDTPIFPYFQLHNIYNGKPIDKFMAKKDVETALEALHRSNASGIIIWGSSSDVNTVHKCNKLLSYVNEVLGPAVVKYTKPHAQDTKKPSISKTANKTVESTQNPTLVDLILRNIGNATYSNAYSKEDITIVVIHKSYYTPTALFSSPVNNKYNWSGASPIQITFNEIHNHNSNNADVLNKHIDTENTNSNVVNSTDKIAIATNAEVLNKTGAVTKESAVAIPNSESTMDENNDTNIVDRTERNYNKENHTELFYGEKHNSTEENFAKVTHSGDYYTEETVTELNSTERSNNEEGLKKARNEDVTEVFYQDERNSTEEIVAEVTHSGDYYTEETVTELNSTERSNNEEGLKKARNEDVTEVFYQDERNSTEEIVAEVTHSGDDYTEETVTELNKTERSNNEDHITEGRHEDVTEVFHLRERNSTKEYDTEQNSVEGSGDN